MYLCEAKPRGAWSFKNENEASGLLGPIHLLGQIQLVWLVSGFLNSILVHCTANNLQKCNLYTKFTMLRVYQVQW